MGDDKVVVVYPIVVTDAKPIRAKANVSNSKPVCVDTEDPDYLMYLEEKREDGSLVVFNVDNNDSPNARFNKVDSVQDQDALNNVLAIEWRDYCDPKNSRTNVVDPDYKMFMENLKIDGYSYSLEVHKNNGSSEIVEYEKDVYPKEYWGKSTGDNVENALGKHTRDLVVHREDAVTRSLRENINTEKENEVLNLVSSKEKKNGVYKIGMSKNIGTKKNSELSVVKKVGGDCSVKVDKSRAQILSESSGANKRTKKPKNDQGSGVGMVKSEITKAQGGQGFGKSERAYDIWLREYDANSMHYNGKGCDLENDNIGASSESEVEVLDRDPDCAEWNYIPVAESNILDGSMEGDDDVHYIGERRKSENPQFRKDIVRIFGRPYNEKEYETLWTQVNNRKPTQAHRDLRGGFKTYSTDTMGKSYLDEYDDFARKLDTFNTDRPRKLNLLRGFFYYLQSLACDGIFKPWLDESCLAIVPRTE